MKKPNILTDASTWNKKDFIKNGGNLALGCAPSNTHFTFTGTVFTLFVSQFNTWVSTNSKGKVTGNRELIEIADGNLLLAKASYRTLTKEVNKQAAHNLEKLKSSGGVLTSDGSALGILKRALIKKITAINEGEAIIKIRTLKQSVGTIVMWKDLTANTIMEHEFFAQKHIIILDGLISGHQYEISVAHKGSVRKVIFSHPVKVTIQ